MRLEDAPPAGWYPDPERRGRLRWWEGSDWADEYRAPPTASEAAAAAAFARLEGSDGERSRFPTPDLARARAPDADQIVAQARDAAREEFRRAADDISRRAQRTLDRYRTTITRYVRLALRWVRIILVAGAVLVVAWFVLQFLAQAALLDWIGDRIDGLRGD